MLISQICCAKSTIARNYPIREYVAHHEPLYDELIIAVSKHDPDGTNDAIREVAGPKVRLVELDWGTSEQVSLKPRHYNEIMNQILPLAQSRWVLKMDIDCFLHEKDFSLIRNLAKEHEEDNICMFEFNLITFRGSLKYVTPFENVWMRPMWKPEYCKILGDGHQPGVILPHGVGQVRLVRDVTFYHAGWMRPNQTQKRIMREHWIDVGWIRRNVPDLPPEMMLGHDFLKFDYEKEKFSHLGERGVTMDDLPAPLRGCCGEWDYYTPTEDQFIPWLPYPYQPPFRVTGNGTPEERWLLDPDLILNSEDIPQFTETRPFD